MSDSAKAQAAAASALPSPGEADYEAICAAVLATERGRWFLAEYARRNRQADTTELLAAIARIAARSESDAAAQLGTPHGGNIPFERLRAELAEVADLIARTRTELALAAADPAARDLGFDPTAGPDGAGAAQHDVLSAAEELQELAWTMREQGFDSRFSDQLDRCAAICLASSRRDRGMQRARRIRHVMRQLQGRIEAIVAMFGAAAPAVQAAAQDAAAPDETPGRDSPVPLGAALLLQTDGQATDALGQAVQIPSYAVADESNSRGAAKGPGPILIGCTPERNEVGEGGDSPAPSDHALSAIAGPPPMGVAPSTPTLTIEGPKGSFSIMPARAAETPDPIAPPTVPQQWVITDGRSACAPSPRLPLGRSRPSSTGYGEGRDEGALPQAQTRGEAPSPRPSPRERGEGAEAAEGTDLPRAAPSPISWPPAALSVNAETKGIWSAFVTAADDDIFREGEADLPLAAVPQLCDPPQRPVGEAAAPARPSTDIAEYLLADIMALGEEERLALFT